MKAPSKDLAAEDVAADLGAWPSNMAAMPATRAEGLVSLSGRIQRLVELYPTQKVAAETVGVATKTLQNWMAGHTIPAFDLLARLAGEKHVSLAWLATGRGAMQNEVVGSLPAALQDFVFVPRYELRAGAGRGQLIENESVKGFLAFREDWVRSRLRRNPANLVVVEAFGDSMSPTIADGDILLVDVSEERVRGPAIYFVRAGSEALVKRIELKMDGSLLLKSDNPTYEPWAISSTEAADFKVLGKVVWAGGLV